MCGAVPKMRIYTDNGSFPQSVRQNMVHSVHNWWKKYVI